MAQAFWLITTGITETSMQSTMVLAFQCQVLSMMLLVKAVDVHAADSCAGGVSLLQNSLRVQSRAHGLQRASKPWETYFYFVGTHHKAGSQLTRNTMKWAFDFLGANYSCQEHHFQHATITSVGGENKCQVSTDCRIHWDNVATQPRVVSNRELAGAGGMKFAHAVRDPKMMLASSYCYHHRGEEYGNPIAPWPDIMFMGPREGLHAVFKGMMKIMINMALIYTKSEADTYHSRYEDMTESSESFDTHVKALFDFMFEDLISPEEHEEIRNRAKKEDLNRGEHGFSAGKNHTNSEDCEAKALAVLERSPDLYEPIQELRTAMGYV
mmetsp:Transcript_26997/g.63384  ORF Transcript_26997/g.63384 Transcript_26997/m.63384 type:complete len:325 (+) Transcript_26997:3-977(+)